MDGAAPAILNAIENATGVSFNRIPLMPEGLMKEFVKLDRFTGFSGFTGFIL